MSEPTTTAGGISIAAVLIALLGPLAQLGVLRMRKYELLLCAAMKGEHHATTN